MCVQSEGECSDAAWRSSLNQADYPMVLITDMTLPMGVISLYRNLFSSRSTFFAQYHQVIPES